MSGHSSGITCPNCGADAYLYTDWKPFDYTSITCNDCGLMINPKVEYMSLEELNEARENEDLEPLEKLPKQNLNF